MEVKILDRRANPLLKRTEYHFEISHTGAATPTRDSVRGELARSVKVPKERVVIERMSAKFGTPRSLGEALIYDSVDDAKAIVREHILLRNGLIERKAAAAPAEAASPGVPVAPAPKPEAASAEAKSAGAPAAQEKSSRGASP